MLAVFLLSLTADSLAMSGRTVAAVAALGAGAVTFVVALGLAAPIPADIEDCGWTAASPCARSSWPISDALYDYLGHPRRR